jgi:hypothetical protein
MNMKTYTYNIFDSNPHTSGAAARPHPTDAVLLASSDAHVRQLVKSRLMHACAALWPDDGYSVDQVIYTLIWNEDGVVVGNSPTYTLTAEDLGLT